MIRSPLECALSREKTVNVRFEPLALKISEGTADNKGRRSQSISRHNRTIQEIGAQLHYRFLEG